MNWRRLLLQTHLYLGLTACAFLIVLGFTGGVLVFENELNRAVNPQLLKVQPSGPELAWETVRQKVEQQEPAWRVQRIYLPASDDDSTYVRLVSRTTGRTREIYADQYTGKVLGDKLRGNQLIWKIHELHINLAAGLAGSRIVVWSSAALLLLACSGIVLWWPRKIFRFAWNARPARVNYDLHRTLGFWSSVTMLGFAVTGINLHIQTGGTLFDMMDTKASAVRLPGHGTTADGLIESAREAIPGARVMRISFWNDAKPVLVQMRFPEDHTPAGRTNVTLDAHTGEVLTAVSSRTAPLLYTALVQWNREIHTGTIFGWPSRILAAVCSLLLGLLALSGSMIWINQKLSTRARRILIAARERQPVA